MRKVILSPAASEYSRSFDLRHEKRGIACSGYAWDSPNDARDCRVGCNIPSRNAPLKKRCVACIRKIAGDIAVSIFRYRIVQKDVGDDIRAIHEQEVVRLQGVINAVYCTLVLNFAMMIRNGRALVLSHFGGIGDIDEQGFDASRRVSGHQHPDGALHLTVSTDTVLLLLRQNIRYQDFICHGPPSKGVYELRQRSIIIVERRNVYPPWLRGIFVVAYVMEFRNFGASLV